MEHEQYPDWKARLKKEWRRDPKIEWSAPVMAQPVMTYTSTDLGILT